MKKVFLTPELPRRIVIGAIDGYCNLKCPMCFVHGNRNDGLIKKIRGKMPYERFCKILDEVKETNIAITPITWSEPFMLNEMLTYLSAIQERNLSTVIHTNGLLLSNSLIKNLVDMEIDSISISIDALSAEILQKKRGIKDIEKIEGNVLNLLKTRGDKLKPRIGVSFTVSDENECEREGFIEKWIKHVDVIRINKQISYSLSVKGENKIHERIPCGALYDTMVINHKGEVVICCLDSHYKNILGNVFEKGVRDIWMSREFQEVRNIHEDERYHEIDICKKCDVWADYFVKETITDDLIIRKSPITEYINRKDKLKTWHVLGKSIII